MNFSEQEGTFLNIKGFYWYCYREQCVREDVLVNRGGTLQFQIKRLQELRPGWDTDETGYLIPS